MAEGGVISAAKRAGMMMNRLFERERSCRGGEDLLTGVGGGGRFIQSKRGQGGRRWREEHKNTEEEGLFKAENEWHARSDRATPRRWRDPGGGGGVNVGQ